MKIGITLIAVGFILVIFGFVAMTRERNCNRQVSGNIGPGIMDGASDDAETTPMLETASVSETEPDVKSSKQKGNEFEGYVADALKANPKSLRI